ncbi:MAG: ribonuclease Z [Bacteroidia bacterium]
MSSVFELTILGSSSATPTAKRNTTAQLLEVAGRFFLIDCGEATQIQLRRAHIRYQRIDRIFISHLHGDHYLGLMGLLSSFHLLGRRNPLHIYCPPGLQEIIELQMKYSESAFHYEIFWYQHQFNHPQLIFADDYVTVETIPLNHRIPCCGFIFREKQRPYTIDKPAIDAHGISLTQIHRIKQGEDIVLEDGRIIENRLLTKGRPEARSYAFCSDTRFSEQVIAWVKGVDLLYHEATFLHSMLDRAKATKHSTAKEAGMVARLAGVGRLLIGHYSVRYLDLSLLAEEAKLEFIETEVVEEFKTYQIPEKRRV